jgi:cold shock CspA family protein
MQATVKAFSTQTTSGSVLLDDGHELEFDADAFARSGLRLLRPGQRVKLRVDAGGRVEWLTIVSLPDPD